MDPDVEPVSRALPDPPAGRAATLVFDHVSKHYHPGPADSARPGAVTDLSLDIPAGRICVLVGPSGCGKTTTLKMVNRLIDPTAGRILIDGTDVATRDVTELRRSIGYVIQQTGLFPHQTVEDNVGTVPRLLGWSPKRRGARTAELLEMVGLEPGRYARRYPAQLSGGERQRVGVARALAADPPIMLMDEPFGAVDPVVRERLQNEFLRLQEVLAKTILFVTHDIDEAIKMGDLVAVMEGGGVLAQFGAPAEILARPSSEHVARFVGIDRGLKRLSLYRVADLPFLAVPLAHVGDPAGTLRMATRGLENEYALLLDAADRPVGWVRADRMAPDQVLSVDMADPASPFLDRRTTLKDALSLLLGQDVQAGVVIDHAGVFQGIVTLGQITSLSHEPRGPEGGDRRPDLVRAPGRVASPPA